MRLEEIGKKQHLDKGKCGHCFKLQNGTVFKKFNNPEILSEIDRFKYFLEYKNDSFCFPFDFVYDETKFYGYISSFAFGEKFYKMFSCSNLLDMSTHSITLENNIKRISEGKIIMYDFHDENLIYDGKKFRVIDPDEYAKSYKSDYSSDEIYRKNILSYKSMIKDLVVDSTVFLRHANFIVNNAYKYCELDMSASEMLYKLKRDMDKHYKEDISTFDDIKKIG